MVGGGVNGLSAGPGLHWHRTFLWFRQLRAKHAGRRSEDDLTRRPAWNTELVGEPIAAAGPAPPISACRDGATRRIGGNPSLARNRRIVDGISCFWCEKHDRRGSGNEASRPSRFGPPSRQSFTENNEKNMPGTRSWPVRMVKLGARVERN